MDTKFSNISRKRIYDDLSAGSVLNQEKDSKKQKLSIDELKHKCFVYLNNLINDSIKNRYEPELGQILYCLKCFFVNNGLKKNEYDQLLEYYGLTLDNSNDLPRLILNDPVDLLNEFSNYEFTTTVNSLYAIPGDFDSDGQGKQRILTYAKLFLQASCEAPDYAPSMFLDIAIFFKNIELYKLARKSDNSFVFNDQIDSKLKNNLLNSNKEFLQEVIKFESHLDDVFDESVTVFPAPKSDFLTLFPGFPKINYTNKIELSVFIDLTLAIKNKDIKAFQKVYDRHDVFTNENAESISFFPGRTVWATVKDDLFNEMAAAPETLWIYLCTIKHSLFEVPFKTEYPDGFYNLGFEPLVILKEQDVREILMKAFLLTGGFQLVFELVEFLNKLSPDQEKIITWDIFFKQLSFDVNNEMLPALSSRLIVDLVKYWEPLQFMPFLEKIPKWEFFVSENLDEIASGLLEFSGKDEESMIHFFLQLFAKNENDSSTHSWNSRFLYYRESKLVNVLTFLFDATNALKDETRIPIIRNILNSFNNQNDIEVFNWRNLAYFSDNRILDLLSLFLQQAGDVFNKKEWKALFDNTIRSFNLRGSCLHDANFLKNVWYIIECKENMVAVLECLFDSAASFFTEEELEELLNTLMSHFTDSSGNRFSLWHSLMKGKEMLEILKFLFTKAAELKIDQKAIFENMILFEFNKKQEHEGVFWDSLFQNDNSVEILEFLFVKADELNIPIFQTIFSQYNKYPSLKCIVEKKKLAQVLDLFFKQASKLELGQVELFDDILYGFEKENDLDATIWFILVVYDEIVEVLKFLFKKAQDLVLNQAKIFHRIMIQLKLKDENNNSPWCLLVDNGKLFEVLQFLFSKATEVKFENQKKIFDNILTQLNKKNSENDASTPWHSQFKRNKQLVELFEFIFAKAVELNVGDQKTIFQNILDQLHQQDLDGSIGWVNLAHFNSAIFDKAFHFLLKKAAELELNQAEILQNILNHFKEESVDEEAPTSYWHYLADSDSPYLMKAMNTLLPWINNLGLDKKVIYKDFFTAFLKKNEDEETVWDLLGCDEIPALLSMLLDESVFTAEELCKLIQEFINGHNLHSYSSELDDYTSKMFHVIKKVANSLGLRIGPVNEDIVETSWYVEFSVYPKTYKNSLINIDENLEQNLDEIFNEDLNETNNNYFLI